MIQNNNILLADDEVHILRVLELKLSSAGFNCIKTSDGISAWKEILRSKPALVISDYQMPGMSGLDLAQKMFENIELRGIPVILLTARGFSLTPDDLTHTNILYRLSKPFSPREILTLVQEVLEIKIKDRVHV